MKYQKIKNVEKPLSKIIFGRVTRDDSGEKMQMNCWMRLYAQGITTFDTAENYGLRRLLGHWLKNRGNREKL